MAGFRDTLGETALYAHLPDRATRGMVILHEALGPQPEIDRVVDRFAAHGYAAVAPTLFKIGYTPACLREAMRTVSTGRGRFIDTTRATRTWLMERTGLKEPQIGLIGFCMAGGFALAAGSGWGAVSTNYGDVPPTEVMKGIGPVIGCYGGRDRVFGKQAPKLEAALRPLGIEVETHTYADAGHSFLTDGHHPFLYALSAPLFHISWNREAAEDGWTKILAFMDRHLAVE